VTVEVEFANVIVVNKADLVGGGVVQRVEGVVAKLNPAAEVVRAVRGNVPLEKLVNTSKFSFEEAQEAAGCVLWGGGGVENAGLKEIRGSHKPESVEYDVTSFVFSAALVEGSS
jgi:G3E family GTPase